MTKTIKEITEKLKNILHLYYPFQEIEDLAKSKLYSEEQLASMAKQKIAECDLLRERAFEEVVRSFSDNSDNLATAFAAFIHCTIIQHLNGEKQSYKDFLCEATERIVPYDLEDAEKLKQFLKGLSVAICDNNYDQIQELYYNYNYSITAVYLFCYYMHSYCVNEDEKSFDNLKNIYHRMNDDMLDYVLCLGNYRIKQNEPRLYIDEYISRYFFPCCFFGSYKEYFADRILDNWKVIAHSLKVSPEEKIELPVFLEHVEDLYNNLKNSIAEQNATNSLDDDLDDLFGGNMSDIEMNVDFLMFGFEDMTSNLGELSKEYGALTIWNNEMIWYDSKIGENDNIFIGQKLHIPTILPNLNYLKKLLETNSALEKAQENRKKILNSFSHRYKNMKTSSLYNVAHALLKMDSKELKKYGRAVLLEYGIKENLKKEVDILQLQFEDNIDKLKEKIQNSTQQQPSQDNFSILEIINNVIKKCIITLVHDGGDESKAIRKFCFKDYDLISIRNSFEENVLFEENMNPVTWFRENIATKFEVNISLFWKEIFFKKHDYADNVISDLLTDILMNCLKYADKTKDIQFDFYDEDNFMIIKSSNTTVKDKTNIPSSGIGLESQNDLLNVLNKAEKKLDNSIAFSETDSIFSIEVRISKNLVRRNENV